MAKHGVSTQDPRFSNNKQRYGAWLMAEGYSIREEHPDGAAWCLIGQDNFERSIIVAQGVKTPDRVDIQGSVIVASEHSAAIESLAETERENFLWDLRFRLLSFEVDFTAVELPMSRIDYSLSLAVDELSRNDFSAAVRKIRHVTIAILWSVLRKAGYPLPPALVSPTRVN